MTSILSKFIVIETKLTTNQIIRRFKLVNKTKKVTFFQDFERHKFFISGNNFKLLKIKIMSSDKMAEGQIYDKGDLRLVKINLKYFDTLLLVILYFPIFVLGCISSIYYFEWKILLLFLLSFPVFYFLSFYVKSKDDKKYEHAFRDILENKK